MVDINCYNVNDDMKLEQCKWLFAECSWLL